jgi:hypothetical protein
MAPSPSPLERLALFPAAFKYFSLFGQSESFVDFFPMRIFKKSFSATRGKSFGNGFDSFPWSFAASAKSGLNYQKRAHLVKLFLFPFSP